MAERQVIKLDRGTVLHMVSDGEGYAYGFIALEPTGQARLWRQVWSDEYSPTDVLFPGFVSAARALIRGEY